MQLYKSYLGNVCLTYIRHMRLKNAIDISSIYLMYSYGLLQTDLEKMAKNLILGLIQSCLAKIWAFFVDFISTSCQALLQAIIVCNFKANMSLKLKKMAKNLILDLIQCRWAQIRATKIPFAIWLCQSLVISWLAIITYNIRKS